MALRSKEDAAEGDPAGARRRMVETLRRMHQQDAEDPIHPNFDDDEELSERMADVDLDDADAIWRRLTPGERKEF